jgi:hypothetical protein
LADQTWLGFRGARPPAMVAAVWRVLR